MPVADLATTFDVQRMLGDLDVMTLGRILAASPSRIALYRAIEQVRQDEALEEPRTPSAARVACVRALLDEISVRRPIVFRR
jgi:hypothetical protein